MFSTASTMPSKTSQQGSVEMERFWNLQRSKFVNNNGAKMVDKLTEANEVGWMLRRPIPISILVYGIWNT